MNGPSPEMVELFLQEASEHLQFLREYSGILQDPYPLYEDIERLYISAHGVAGTGGTYGYKHFNEVASKLAHIFQYAMNATVSPEATAPLVEFIYEAIAVLESDLIMISANSMESVDDIASFKQRYPFAFQGPPPAAADAPTEQPHPPDAEISDAEVKEEPLASAPLRVTLATPPAPAEAPVAPTVKPVETKPPAASPVKLPPPPPAALPSRPPAVAPPASYIASIAPSAPPSSAALASTTTPPPSPVQLAPSATPPPARLTSEPLLEPLAEPLAEPEPLVEPLVEPVSPPAPLPASSTASLALPAPPPVVSSAPLASQVTTPALQAPLVLPAPSAPLIPALPVELPKPPDEVKISITGVRELGPDDELPPEVLEFFIPEIEEHLQTITDCLLALEAHPNEEDIHRLFRAMHTIKGSAAQVGAHRIASIAHRAEELVGRLRDGELKPSATIVDLCLETVDVLKKLIYRQWEDDAAFQVAARSLLARLEGVAPTPVEVISAPAAPEPLATPPQVTATTESAPLPESLEAKPEAKLEVPEPVPVPVLHAPVGMAQSKSVRIALERLDRMMNAVGELVINRTRMLGRLAELEKLAEVLNFSKGRMGDKVTEFQDKYEFSRVNSVPLLSSTQWPGSVLEMHQGGGYGVVPFEDFASPGYGNPAHGSRNYGAPGGSRGYRSSFDASPSEFSELEMDRYDDFGILSRSLTEISNDITEVLTQLDGFVRRVDGDIDEFTKLAHRLQDEITQARMVPIGNLFTRIARTVRDASKASNKQVELTLAGAETELDNNIIQQIADPLLHLVRNAVAHGIERADERYEAGKPDQGNIAVRAYHKGNHIYVEVEDDGRGVDFDRVKSTAVESGFLSADDADRLSRRELTDLLFRPGFSTAPRRTELAGRGVGLDVVRSNVDNLNGEIEVETEKGIGTRFTLKVPLTLIISQALFVQCGEQTFAFPLGFVEEIRRIRPNEIEEVGGKLITKVRDVLTEVVRFDEALQLPRLQPINGYFRMVLVNIGGRQVGVVVEEVLRKDEIVIKSLGEYLHNVKLFPGATIAPDGSLILLVDISRLIMGESIERRPLTTVMNASRLFMPGATAVARGEIPAAAVDAVGKEKLVVLADDSISVRKFVGRMLEKAGYRVKLACDGLEALEIATSNACDLVITDLEMPRTNGYELMLHLRQTPSTSKVPVMVVTSRAGAKHRERALKEGAAAFMVKPVQEESFITQVLDLIGSSGQVLDPPVVH